MAKRRGVPAVHFYIKGEDLIRCGDFSHATGGWCLPVPSPSSALTPAFGGNTVYYIGIGIGGTLLATGCVLLIRTDMAREKTRLEARAAC